MPPTASALPISANEAFGRAAAETRNTNRKSVPELSPMIKEMSDKQSVHIYNVGPWAHRRIMGSLGTYIIPACAPGQPYAEMSALPGVFSEPVIGASVNDMELRIEPGGGRYVAEQILGIGKMLAPKDSLEHVGVFIGAIEGPDARPTKPELEQARKKLREYYLALVNQAKRAYEKGPKEAEQTISDKHRLAAAELKLEDEPWMSYKLSSGNKRCELCGHSNDERNVICANCKDYVFDPEAYAKLKNRTVKG